MKKSSISILLGVIILSAIVLYFGLSQQTIINGGSYVTSNGDTVVKQIFLQSMLHPGGYCEVNQVTAGCYPTTSAFLNTYVFREYARNGWSLYQSCAGYMNFYGCNPANCVFSDGAVCKGSVTDSASVSCSVDSQCINGLTCLNGKCEKATCTSQEGFMCSNGALYTCVNGDWRHWSECDWVLGKNNKCVNDGAKGTTYSKLCQEDAYMLPYEKVVYEKVVDEASYDVKTSGAIACSTNAQCKPTTEKCLRGLCVPAGYGGTSVPTAGSCTTDADCEGALKCHDGLCGAQYGTTGIGSGVTSGTDGGAGTGTGTGTGSGSDGGSEDDGTGNGDDNADWWTQIKQWYASNTYGALAIIGVVIAGIFIFALTGRKKGGQAPTSTQPIIVTTGSSARRKK